MSAVHLGKVLRAEADKISNVRLDLRDREVERDEQLARNLDNAAELVRVLARLVEGMSVPAAFGAPGDFGYDTPIGSALHHFYSTRQAEERK